MVYGKSNVFDADRLIDLLTALEDYSEASTSARGDMDRQPALPPSPNPTSTKAVDNLFSPAGGFFPLSPLFPSSPIPALAPAFFNQIIQLSPFAAALQSSSPMLNTRGALSVSGSSPSEGQTREALRFILSPKGVWFREFVMDELVKSVDALSREQAVYLLTQLGLESTKVPILLPSMRLFPLAPSVTEEDKLVVSNVTKIIQFLLQGQSLSSFLLPSPTMAARRNSALVEVLPHLPELAREMVPELVNRLASRVGARLIRDLYMN